MSQNCAAPVPRAGAAIRKKGCVRRLRNLQPLAQLCPRAIPMQVARSHACRPSGSVDGRLCARRRSRSSTVVAQTSVGWLVGGHCDGTMVKLFAAARSQSSIVALDVRPTLETRPSSSNCRKPDHPHSSFARRLPLTTLQAALQMRSPATRACAVASCRSWLALVASICRAAYELQIACCSRRVLHVRYRACMRNGERMVCQPGRWQSHRWPRSSSPCQPRIELPVSYVSPLLPLPPLPPSPPPAPISTLWQQCVAGRHVG